MVDTFYSGSFGPLGPSVEWDGTNHEEILDWVNEVATDAWFISSVTATELYFSKPGDSYSRIARIGVAPWIMRDESGPSPFLIAGRWKTQDPNGRPASMDDLLYDPPA